MIRHTLFSLLLLSLYFVDLQVIAQPPIYLNGYTESKQGEIISYHAPDPRAETALLVRAQDSTKVIEWLTAAVQEDIDKSMVSFVWLFGMDTSPDQQVFTLSVDGIDLFEFNNPAMAEKKDIEYGGDHGAILRFRTTKIDQHKDVMGYAIMILPSELISPGKPVRLQVRGKTSGSNIWYMTFQFPVEEKINIKPQHLLVHRNGENLQAVLLEMVNLDVKKEVIIKAEGQSAENFEIQPGYNALQYFVPEVKNKKDIPVSIKIGNEAENIVDCSIEPVRQWTVYFVQHTHTDIGYTRPQSEILPEHLRFIDYALDYCDQTDHFPDDSKFRWTCESAWAVDQYLQRRPENQIKRFLKRIGEGRIEVTAMPFNMSEIADETALKNMILPVRHFHERGIQVTTAMQDDVNGIGWCMADYLPDVGVKYLIMGEHGHRALIPFELPTTFWWESPSGKKMLAFRAEHYMYGNFLLLHTGDLDNFRSNLLNYLDNLEEKNYPFDQISLQYSGYVTDNSPPALTPNHLIRAWNEKYIWPKLRSATASEFMRFIDKNHSHDLENIRKAWPDWWTDGFGSAARETAAAREAQSEMNTTTGLLAMSAVFGSEINDEVHHRIQEIYENILFYDEHTFGAAESISEPYAENSMKQWAEKSSYAWEALKQSRILREEAFGLLQEHLPKYEVPAITVFNTLNWSRSGPVKVYIDHEILEPGEKFSILDSSDNSIPAQVLSSRSDGTYWVLWVNDIPPLGYKSFRIQTGKGRVHHDSKKSFSGNFENEFWSLKVSPKNGSFTSLFYKMWNHEMLDPESEWKPGQLIYERLSNRHQLELFTLEEVPERTSLRDVSFNYIEDGPLWTTLSVSGMLDDCAIGPVKIEYRFYNTEPVIEMIYSMIKKPVTDPEALYVAFPFKMGKGEIFFEAQGGAIRPGKDQLAGTASDWNTVQNFVSVRSDECQITLSSPEIPLFHMGGLNLGNFSYYHQPASNHFYSWVLNNYWTTNFKASQEGTLRWRYFIALTDEPGNVFASQFGWESCIPFVGRVVPQGEKNSKKESESIFTKELTGLLLVNTIPSRTGNGVIFQIREIAGRNSTIDPKNLIKYKPNVQCHEVNAIGEILVPNIEKVIFQPNSVHFIEITWNQ